MGIFDRFPYSSTHEMNLDYMLGKATEIAEDMQTVTAGMAQVQAGLSAISEKTEQATQAAAQAAASASSIEGSVTAAEEAAEEAQMHNESAQTWANNAMTYKADCQRSATEAAASSSSAAQAATAAAASEDTVAQYAQAANASAQSAANNNDSAHQYANQASASASNATFHSSNAQTAATNAANSASQAAATKTDVENLVESLPEDFTDLNNTINQVSDEIDDVKSAISDQVISNNLVGNEEGVLYPVHIAPGEKITCSTSDGSQFGDPVLLQFVAANGTQTQYYTMNGTSTSRTITTESNKPATAYLRWNVKPHVPMMVCKGDTVLSYEPYFLPIKKYAEEINGKLSSLKSALTNAIQLTLENYQVTITTSTNKVVPGISTAWQHAVVNVQPGDMIHVITTIYGNTYFGLLFARDDDYVIASYEKATENATENANKNIDVYYVVPAKATKLYINYRTNQSLTPSAETIITVNGIKNIIADQPLNILRLISVNCGSYNIGDNSDYVSRWHKMYSDTDFDLVALQDSPFSGDYTQATLFGNTVVQSIDSDANPYDIHFESRYNLTDPYLLSVTNTIEFQGETITNSFRAKFLRAILKIGNKSIAVYSVHAAPGETAGITALRAAQFADLIADSQNYDGAIMMGDFNAHASSEYAPFTTAGMRLGNCGYVGEIYTLGSSQTTQKIYPADNIITSSNIIIRKFEALSNYSLNTDHYPVFAVIEII